MKSAVLFLGLLAVVWGQTTDVSTCLYQGGVAQIPINSYVVGCTSPPCAFPQLTHAEIRLIFRSPRTIHSMQTLAFAYIFGPIGAPYDLGNEAVTCNFLTNTYCPLLENEVVEYTLRMLIESWMPAGTSVTIEFVIRDNADNSSVACIRTQVQILPPVESRGLSSNNTIFIDATK